MLRKYLLLIFSIALLFGPALAQEDPNHHTNKCGHKSLEAFRASTDPDYLSRISKERAAFEQHLQESPPNNARVQATIRIPVVVHVMHAPGEGVGVQSNISVNQILSQIEVLNEDYRRTAGSRGFNNNPVGADTEIEFCLATKDPQGNPTSGINRVVYSNSANHSFALDQTMKALSVWPTNRYLNMWVVKSINGGVLGYAYLPPDMANDPNRSTIDGVVMGARYFGSRDKQAVGETFFLANNFDLGRTTTHEVGHFLNLEHTWGDGDCNADDGVGDTPNCDGPYFGCTTAPVQCGNTRMIENYMDYSDDRCMNIFTQGQKTRMTSALNFYSFRASLFNPTNLSLTGCADSSVVTVPDTMFINGGNNQVQRILRGLTNPLQVRVLNEQNTGFAGLPVRFRLVAQPAGSNSVFDTVVVTNFSGVAAANFTMGPIPGVYTIAATAAVNSGDSLLFSQNAISEAAAFPNPFEREVVLKLDLPTEEVVDVQVFDTRGGLIYRKNFTVKSSLVLDLFGFPDGQYQVKAVSSQLVDVFRVVKVTPLKRIGLLSDTHGYLDPRIKKYFDEVDEIWHAGDIGPLAVTDQLALWKPLRAVYGNIDDHRARLQFPEDLYFELEGLRVFITHIGGYPSKYPARIKAKLNQYQPGLFICGHSHILRVMPDPVFKLLHINPGAAGNHGFHKVKTLVRFAIDQGKLKELQVIELGPRSTDFSEVGVEGA